MSGPGAFVEGQGGGWRPDEGQRPANTGTDYRTGDQHYLAQHYGQGMTSAQCAAQLGRTPGAVRAYVCRHRELRRGKAQTLL